MSDKLQFVVDSEGAAGETSDKLKFVGQSRNCYNSSEIPPKRQIGNCKSTSKGLRANSKHT